MLQDQEGGGRIDHSEPDEDDEEQAPVPDIEDENKNEEGGEPNAGEEKDRWPTPGMISSFFGGID